MSQNFGKNEFLKNLFISFGDKTRKIMISWIIRISTFFLLLIGAIIPNIIVRVIIYLISMLILWVIGLFLINYISIPLVFYRSSNVFMLIFDSLGFLIIFGVFIINAFSPNSPIGIILFWTFVNVIEVLFEDSAWEKFEQVLNTNTDLFPSSIIEEFTSGIKKLRGATLVIVFPFLLFLVIIGLILFRKGYKKINKVMKKFIQMDKSLLYQIALYKAAGLLKTEEEGNPYKLRGRNSKE
jgi:hypothetical protein